VASLVLLGGWPSWKGTGSPRLLSCMAPAIISGNAAAFQGCGTLSHSAAQAVQLGQALQPAG